MRAQRNHIATVVGKNRMGSVLAGFLSLILAATMLGVAPALPAAGEVETETVTFSDRMTRGQLEGRFQLTAGAGPLTTEVTFSAAVPARLAVAEADGSTSWPRRRRPHARSPSRHRRTWGTTKWSCGSSTQGASKGS
jgi:hypothetical protein